MSQALSRPGNPTQVTFNELMALRAEASRLRLSQSHAFSRAAGPLKSRQYGRGMDYAESRVYQAGDDIRRLDWRLTARSGKLHTKLFQEDRQGSLLILFDTSPSLHFGSRGCFKSVQAARAAAIASWQTIQHGELAGLVCFGTSDKVLLPASGHKAAIGICKTLADLSFAQPPGAARQPLFAAALKAVRRANPSRVLLISDGLNLNDQDMKQLIISCRHRRLSILQVADALEIAPPAAGHYAFQIHQKPLSVALFGKARQQFFAQLNQGQQRLQQLARRHGLPYQCITGDQAPAATIGKLLGKRGGQ